MYTSLINKHISYRTDYSTVTGEISHNFPEESFMQQHHAA